MMRIFGREILLQKPETFDLLLFLFTLFLITNKLIGDWELKSQ